jgi:transcriptional regulator with GAF, ATPase, and Fis domain
VVEVVNCRLAESFSDSDLRFLEALSGSIAIALDNARLYAEARQAEARLRTQVGVLRRDLARQYHFDEMVGTGSAMAEAFQLMETAAASSITVLIEGETGTGKELVARGIHRASARADGPFLAVNCAAMPETLLESELFGHRRGAFTGAIRDNPGLFRAATGGTVFLDEIGDMPAAMQAKLLRVLEEGEVIPLGESVASKVDVRVLSATNRELRNEVRLGRFRDDLYYRVAVFPIKLPPLRARREDIPLLVRRFVERAAERQHKHISGFDEAALTVLAVHHWPGNIRELQNEIERAVALAPKDGVLGLDQISSSIRESALAGDRSRTLHTMLPPGAGAAYVGGLNQTASGRSAAAKGDDAKSGVAPNTGDYFGETVSQVGTIGAAPSPPQTNPALFRDARAAFEARYIEDMLVRCDHNVSRAAKVMGMSRVQLQRKIKEYALR